jgi:hypothetical protein
MTTRKLWIRCGMLAGKATTDSPATLTSPTYNLAFGTQTAFTLWKEYVEGNTDLPTMRVIRNKFRTRIAYWLSVTPTSADWQTDLSEIKVGNKVFQKPDHTHCNDLYARFDPGDENHTVIKTITYPDGSTVPDPKGYEYTTGGGGVESFRIVIRSEDGRWYKDMSTTAYAAASTHAIPYKFWAEESQGIKNNIWPQSPFQAFGTIQLNRNFDWCPPVALGLRLGATSPVEADCVLFLAYLDHLAPNANFQISTRVATSTTNGTGDTLANAFPYSQIRRPKDGLYRPNATPTNPSDVWLPTQDSDTAGYDPPDSEDTPAKCLFIVKEQPLPP